MYTPEEIRNIEFTKSLGGYRTSEVDPFIDKCADTVEALMQEKAELTKKLEVLADKLVEYRNEEDSIRTALLSAQRLGDTVVREANHKAGLILEDANIKAQKIADTARSSIQAEEAELERVKKEVAAFKNQMLNLYRDHLALLKLLPDVKEEAAEAACCRSGCGAGGRGPFRCSAGAGSGFHRPDSGIAGGGRHPGGAGDAARGSVRSSGCFSQSALRQSEIRRRL